MKSFNIHVVPYNYSVMKEPQMLKMQNRAWMNWLLNIQSAPNEKIILMVK